LISNILDLKPSFIIWYATVAIVILVSSILLYYYIIVS
jgi:hypothetical protein